VYDEIAARERRAAKPVAAPNPVRINGACPPGETAGLISSPPSTPDWVDRIDRGLRGGSLGCRLGRRGSLSGRQLNHAGVLSRSQTREQHDPPIREFQRVVVRMGVAQVDLPELGHVGPELAQSWQYAAESMIKFGLLVEHYLRTREQADRNVGLPDRGKAACRRTGEACCHQLVADPGRAGCGIV
jgi:hypothetical protein